MCPGQGPLDILKHGRPRFERAQTMDKKDIYVGIFQPSAIIPGMKGYSYIEAPTAVITSIKEQPFDYISCNPFRQTIVINVSLGTSKKGDDDSLSPVCMRKDRIAESKLILADFLHSLNDVIFVSQRDIITICSSASFETLPVTRSPTACERIAHGLVLEVPLWKHSEFDIDGDCGIIEPLKQEVIRRRDNAVHEFKTTCAIPTLNAVVGKIVIEAMEELGFIKQKLFKRDPSSPIHCLVPHQLAVNDVVRMSFEIQFAFTAELATIKFKLDPKRIFYLGHATELSF
jgi:hypothetical protein